MLELVWQVGANLMREGLLDDPQDILLITPEELEDIGKNIGSKVNSKLT